MRNDELRILGTVAAIFILLVLAVFAVGYAANAYQCTRYASVTGRPTTFAAGDCYVKDGGSWYQWDEYKNRLVAQGRMK